MARPQLVQPSPGGLITAQAKNALQAERTDPVLLVGHVPHRLEPKAQWLSSALEDRPRRHRCLTLTPVASQLTPRRRPGVGSAARRASKTFRPTNTPKKLRTRRLRHEPRVEFSQGARVVDPAFGMGCRVRHPNILTSRERSGYPIKGLPLCSGRVFGILCAWAQGGPGRPTVATFTARFEPEAEAKFQACLSGCHPYPLHLGCSQSPE